MDHCNEHTERNRSCLKCLDAFNKNNLKRSPSKWIYEKALEIHSLGIDKHSSEDEPDNGDYISAIIFYLNEQKEEFKKLQLELNAK